MNWSQWKTGTPKPEPITTRRSAAPLEGSFQEAAQKRRDVADYGSSSRCQNIAGLPASRTGVRAGRAEGLAALDRDATENCGRV